MVNHWSKIIQSFKRGYQYVVNDICHICYQTNIEREVVCNTCYGRLPWLGPACALCAYPLAEGYLCTQCLGNENYLDGAKALFRYTSPIKEFVYQLKFHERLYLAQLFGEWLGQHLRPGFEVDMILPVPLAVGRLKLRGFNQSLEITKRLAYILQVPYLADAIVRKRETPYQSALGQQQRIRNLSSRDFYCPSSFANRRILLIDDVLTTGRTLQCLAKALRMQGASKIEAWTVCRSV